MCFNIFGMTVMALILIKVMETVNESIQKASQNTGNVISFSLSLFLSLGNVDHIVLFFKIHTVGTIIGRDQLQVKTDGRATKQRSH